jgi:hypothetical protein
VDYSIGREPPSDEGAKAEEKEGSASLSVFTLLVRWKLETSGWGVSPSYAAVYTVKEVGGRRREMSEQDLLGP